MSGVRMARFVAVIVLAGLSVTARAQRVFEQEPGKHPPVVFKDAAGVGAVASGRPVDAARTCGGCHDTSYINSHTVHSEKNCFVCHVKSVDADAWRRVGVNSPWAGAAALAGTGLVDVKSDGVARYNQSGFDSRGAADPERLGVGAPRGTNCGICHGGVAIGESPVRMPIGPGDEMTALTGAIFSGQPLSISGMNLAGKTGLTRPWDIHADRLMDCRHCHQSRNNPVYNDKRSALDQLAPAHLVFDARRVDFVDYLARPDHRIARGSPSHRPDDGAPRDNMRRCADCHDATRAHDWLPFKRVHFASISCESCHLPRMSAPAVAQVDATVVGLDGKPVQRWRGIEGGSVVGGDRNGKLVRGFEPVLIPRHDRDGFERVTPHNLVTRWTWVAPSDKEPKAVDPTLVRSAYLDGQGAYAPEVVKTLDRDGNSVLDESELVLDTREKVDLIVGRLAALGATGATIHGEVSPVSIHHGVVGRGWAEKRCESCHATNSRVGRVMPLGDAGPAGALPVVAQNDRVNVAGRVASGPEGLVFEPARWTIGVYVPGRDRLWFIDALGALAVLGSLAGVAGHGGMRIFLARRRNESTRGQGR